jgi:hypothetical protein
MARMVAARPCDVERLEHGASGRKVLFEVRLGV